MVATSALLGVSETVDVPGPETEGAVIKKAAAAIVQGGRLLLVRKFGTRQLIMPGGGVEAGETAVAALHRELREELGATARIIDEMPIGVYRAPAAFEPGMDVEITLYGVELETAPRASEEIEELVWFAPGDVRHSLSPIVEQQIVPSLQQQLLL